MVDRDDYIILGKVLRRERDEACYNGKEIGDRLGLNKQLISDIETGRNSVSDSKIKTYAKFLNISFERSDIQRKKDKEEFEEILNYVIYANLDMFCLRVEELHKKENEYIRTLREPMYHLISFIYYYLKDNHVKIKETTKIIDKYFKEIFNDEELFIYLLYQGNYCIQNKKWNEALEIFNVAEKRILEVSEKLKAMLYYSFGYAYWHLGKTVASLDAHNKAKNSFDATNNYMRSLYTSCHIGRNLMHMYRFDEAEKLYNNLLSSAELMQNENALVSIHVGMTENYFYKGDYEKAIKSSDWLLKKNIYKVSMYEIRMWSYYKLNKYDECNEAKKHMISMYNYEQKYYELVAKAMECLLKKNKDDSFRALTAVYDYLEENNLYIVMDFILEELINILQESKLYKAVSKYNGRRSELLRRKIW